VILGGEHDFMPPPSVLTPAARHADDLSVETVPGCGHYLHEERPELVARAAERLFSGKR
jgi:pimeloyl-ACP methyl ester carboxylesterase